MYTMKKKQPPIIELTNINFSYNHVPILENITLNVYEKDFLGIIGPNGGGKTTLIKIVLGLLKPTRGKITIFGKPPAKGRSLIGYVPQAFNFHRDFPITVLDVVLMGQLRKTKIGHRYALKDKTIAQSVLEQVEMFAFKDRPISNLSGGQLQRVMIARALISKPKLLILDEPLSNIDSRWQTSFYQLLRQLKQSMAIMLVTHDTSALLTYVDQVACLNRQLYYHGPTKEGLQHLSDAYQCPIELIGHGIPHRVLGDHS
jgi:zinc transport system ATP-binding protein